MSAIKHVALRGSAYPDVDVASASNKVQVCITHISFRLSVSFDSKRVIGSAVYSLVACQDATEVIFDSHEIAVEAVTDAATGDPIPHQVKFFAKFGSALHIARPFVKGENAKIEIRFRSGGGPACTWLDPQQTAMKEKPYLFTQGQACLNRSLFPCQDTPSVKQTYDATVTVPRGFTALMSALRSGQECPEDADEWTYRFEMKQRISSYLVALAVGDFVSADIGPRSKVWCERCIVERAKAEFDGVVEEYIRVGEKLYGKYRWGQYDLLIMPPSFPFGGMENPLLTFVTPTLLVGDRSLADVIIHEISHSWFGNTVTNKNWSEFWLNEGFTMYAQRRITTELFGAAFTALECSTGRSILLDDIAEFGEDSPLTQLRVPISDGVDPEDTYCEVPYEKGFACVSYLREVVGSDEAFDSFLAEYVDHFFEQSIQAEDFFDFFFAKFPQHEHIRERPDGHSLHDWLYTRGMPPWLPDLSAAKELTDPADELAVTFASDGSSVAEGVVASWGCQQLCYLLNLLVDAGLDEPQIKCVDEKCNFSSTLNPEVRLRWSQLTIKAKYDRDLPNVRKFLCEQGKQKYTVPLYRALMRGSDAAKGLAAEVFAETRDGLHPNVRGYVEKILSPDE
eukprot:TRINITY_DN12206_c0_g1_i1.p1 TRINITY_DN12206_c0_g1~~TRINITY_DN12206_c0_g1_i1.p1  ORF type:complete len:623 (-),score=231.79 TRINITY_DN12206_c0_g1_i1:226-2094(-)